MKAHTKSTIAAAAFAIFVIGPLTYWAVDRSSPVKFLEGSLAPDTIDAGGAMAAMRSIQWLRFDCANTVIADIEDANGRQWKLPNFSVRTPDHDLCVKATSERDAKAGIARPAPICIVNSVSSPPERGVHTVKPVDGKPGIASGPAKYQVVVEFRCGTVGSWMRPIKVVAPALVFSVR
jgi:hypothetical protein